jgi:hypothetical protein
VKRGSRAPPVTRGSYGSLNKAGTTFLIDGSYVIDAATGSPNGGLLVGITNDGAVIASI